MFDERCALINSVNYDIFPNFRNEQNTCDPNRSQTNKETNKQHIPTIFFQDKIHHQQKNLWVITPPKTPKTPSPSVNEPRSRTEIGF